MKPQIGDIIEINTRKGFAYAIFTHHKANYGAVIRVFDRLYAQRPERIGDEVVKNPIQFSTLFPLSAAVSQDCVKIVDNVVVPKDLERFPLFRSGMINPFTKRVEAWALWDGERSQRVERLTSDQYKLPVRGVWNDTLLIERIEEGWRPENDKVYGMPK